MASNTVLTISDAHNVHHLTEGHIDEWWRSLPTARKVALFEAELEAPPALALEDAFQAYAEQFLADMERLHKSPLAGLIPAREASHAAL